MDTFYVKSYGFRHSNCTIICNWSIRSILGEICEIFHKYFFICFCNKGAYNKLFTFGYYFHWYFKYKFNLNWCQAKHRWSKKKGSNKVHISLVRSLGWGRKRLQRRRTSWWLWWLIIGRWIIRSFQCRRDPYWPRRGIHVWFFPFNVGL